MLDGHDLVKVEVEDVPDAKHGADSEIEACIPHVFFDLYGLHPQQFLEGACFRILGVLVQMDGAKDHCSQRIIGVGQGYAC